MVAAKQAYIGKERLDIIKERAKMDRQDEAKSKYGSSLKQLFSICLVLILVVVIILIWQTNQVWGMFLVLMVLADDEIWQRKGKKNARTKDNRDNNLEVEQ